MRRDGYPQREASQRHRARSRRRTCPGAGQGRFTRIVMESPNVALKVMEALSVRIRHTDEQISGLSERSLRDELTGLLNRRSFQDRLAEECDRGRRYGDAFALVVLDLDHFKRVNDTFGHDVGDTVLEWVGRLLGDHTRGADVAFRIGGGVRRDLSRDRRDRGRSGCTPAGGGGRRGAPTHGLRAEPHGLRRLRRLPDPWQARGPDLPGCGSGAAQGEGGGPEPGGGGGRVRSSHGSTGKRRIRITPLTNMQASSTPIQRVVPGKSMR